MIEIALFLQLILCLAVAAFFVAHRSASLFHPLFFYLVFHGLVFVIRPWLVHYAGFDSQWQYMRIQPTPEVFLLTLAVSSVALLIFAGFALSAGHAAIRFDNSGIAFTRTQRQAFYIVIVLLLPIALYGAKRDAEIFGLLAARGESGMFLDPTSAHTFFQNTTGYVVKAHNLLIPLTALFVAVNRFRWWAYVPLLAFCGYRMYLGSRWGIVVALGIVVLLHLYWHRARWMRMRYIVLAIPVFLVFHALGQDRDYFREATGVGEARYRVEAFQDEGFAESLDAPDFANFDFLAYIVRAVPDKSHTYTYFTQYLWLFTQPIPRMVWPDKPRGMPIKLVDLNDYGWFGTRTWSIVGDGWLSFGFLGVVITLGAVGWSLGRLHRWFASYPHRAFPVLVYCCFMPATMLWFRDGNIVSAAKLAMWILLPVFMWLAVSKGIEWLVRDRQELQRVPVTPPRPQHPPPGRGLD
jgi:hypothetical protein